ncbi:MAG TPA: acyltransferase [Spongiibacteraceae bacterium]|nr:acyltransferase [Spongiibacteraceae bacterium]
MESFHKIVTVNNLQHHCPIQPITGLDIGYPTGGAGLVLVYQQVLNREVLIASLQKALDRVPYFAGRIVALESSQPLVVPNNEGVLFSHAHYRERMPRYEISRPLKPQIHEFVPYIDSCGFDRHTPLLQIKLSTFLQGSILGIAVSHVFCDGISTIDFLNSWAAYARNASAPAAPAWQRHTLKSVAEDSDKSNLPTAMIELEQPLQFYAELVACEIFHLPAALLERLYKKYGTVDTAAASPANILTAYIFLTLARCRLQADEPCSLTLVYNTRKILGLASDYLGNAVALRSLQWTCKQIIELGVAALARSIRQLYPAITANDLRREQKFMEQKMTDGTAAQFLPEASYRMLTGGVLINNVAKFPLYDLDFGSGRPIWYEAPPQPVPTPVCRGVLICPTPPERDGVDIHVTLPSAEMIIFSKLVGRMADPVT